MSPVNDRPGMGALAASAPALIAAVSFASVSVFGKASFVHGADVPTFLAFRGLLGVAVLWLWLKGVPRLRELTRRERLIGLGMGLLYAGNVYALFLAIERIPVPIASLTYFIYPLLTGIVGGLTGLDRFGARGVIASVVAFGGLALMVGAHAGELAWAGVGLAATAAVFRSSMLLATRAALPAVDPREVSWYTMIGSAAVFAAACAASGTVSVPSGAFGWVAFTGASLAAAVALLAMFVSARRIGPFRTALIMNAEPLATVVLAWVVLGEAMNATQWLGAAIMLAALFWFQLRR